MFQEGEISQRCREIVRRAGSVPMSAEEIVRATMTDKGLDPEDGRLRHDLMGRFFMALHRPHTAEWAPSGACSVCWEGGWHDVRLLVFGGRLYTDMVAVWRILDAIHRKHGLTCVIDGACPMGGADLLAHEWAAEHNVVSERYPVNHVTDGQWPGAGPMRNARMLRDGKPDQAVGFPGDRGTRDMDRRCRVAGIVPWHPFGQAWLLAEEPAAVAAGPRLAVVIRQSAGELANWRNRPVPLTY